MLISSKDDPPSHIEDLFDELEGGKAFQEVSAQMTATDAGWLARFIKEKCEKEREQCGEEIERDLKVSSTFE